MGLLARTLDRLICWCWDRHTRKRMTYRGQWTRDQRDPADR